MFSVYSLMMILIYENNNKCSISLQVNAFILGTLVLGLALPLKLCYVCWVSQRGEPEKAPLIESGLKK